MKILLIGAMGDLTSEVLIHAMREMERAEIDIIDVAPPTELVEFRLDDTMRDFKKFNPWMEKPVNREPFYMGLKKYRVKLNK